MAAEWYYARGKEKVGPLTAAELKQLTRSGELSRSDMVWKEGMAKWTQADQVKGLFDVAPSQAVRASVPPPLPLAPPARTSAVADAPLLVAAHSAWGKLQANKLALLGCCLGISILLTWAIPVLIEPANRSTFPPDILSEPGFEKVKSWDDPRLLAEIDKRERENTRTRNGSRSSLGIFTRLMLLLADLGLVVAMGAVASRRLFASKTDKFYEEGGPELPPGYPWTRDERTTRNPAILWLKIGMGASIVVGVVCLASIVGAIFCLPFFSLAILIYMMGLRRSRLHARWVPVEGQKGWIEFASGGVYRQEDGAVGTFAVLPNQKFIDILVSGHLVDSWKILSWGMTTLEIQDMAGRARNFKKGQTFAEKQAAEAAAAFFRTDRSRLLQRKWEPVNDDGPAIQFTEDGAMIRFDGFAARYTLTGEEPNEVILIHIDDTQKIQLKVLSLNRDEMVLTGEGGTGHYRRGVSITDAESQRRADAAKEKLMAVGKAALLTVGAIGAGIAVLGVAAAATAQTTCPRCGFTRTGLHTNCPNCAW